MQNKRLGIFAFYEENGVVEKYVQYLLSMLRPCLSDLIIVCNGALSEEGRIRLGVFTDKIVMRKNKGYDAGAFREILVNYLGKAKLQEYDELVLCNDTFFGPFITFDQIFSQMESGNPDFWGLSAQPESSDFWTGREVIVPAFIHSFFIVIRSNMLHSKAFWEYFYSLHTDGWGLTDVVQRHEQYFTRYFDALGYRWDVYTKVEWLNGSVRENSYTAYLVLPYELIRYGNCPFLKKKCITGKDISQEAESENASFRKALSYIENDTKYDADLIYQYMLNNCSREHIAKKLQLYFAASAERGSKRDKFKKAKLIVYVPNLLTFRILCNYLEKLPLELRCIMLVEENCRAKLRELDSRIQEIIFCNKSDVLTRINEILKKLPKFIDYIGVLLNFKTYSDFTVGNQISELEKIYDGMMADSNYVSNVLDYLESDIRMGLLTPANGRHNFGQNANNDWIEYFWAKKGAIDDLKNYYMGLIYHEKTIVSELYKSEYLISSMAVDLNVSFMDLNTPSYLRQRLLKFCRKYEKLYIYGAGGVAKRTANLLKDNGMNFEGFIVSDGQTKDDYIMDHKISFLSELDLGQDGTGIVIAVEERLFSSIVRALVERKFKNYEYSYL